MKFSSFLLFLLILTWDFAQAEVFRCFNSAGQPIFTDNKLKCSGQERGQASAEVERINVKNYNVHSQFGASVSEEYYNYSFREYLPLDGYSIPIIAEKKLHDTDSKNLTAAAQKLSSAIERSCKIFTKAICAEFAQIKYFLFMGKESRTGGRHGGQWYFPVNNRISKHFDDSIVVRSIYDYLIYSEDEALMTALHELSHAYYFRHIKRLYQTNNAAYQNAEKNNLYQKVKSVHGQVLEKAYALTNEKEYFAELAKTYLFGNHYFPFTGKELREYDPVGYAMISNAFIIEL